MRLVRDLQGKSFAALEAQQHLAFPDVPSVAFITASSSDAEPAGCSSFER
jgi:hypothetical protein